MSDQVSMQEAQERKLEMEVAKYKRRTNMSVSDLKRWSGSKTYKEYSKRKSGEPASVAVERNIMLQRKIGDGSISVSDLDELEKANLFLKRAKAEYYQEGAGDNKIPGGRTTFRIAALRGWAFDPYSTYG